MIRALAASVLAALVLASASARGEPFDCPESILHTESQPGRSASLVLIIDDIGHQQDNGLASVRLPGRVTIAVLPFTPHGKALATLAHAGGKEVMLHAPMSKLGDSQPLGEGGLTAELTEVEFREALAAQLREIPYVRGVNNHMGSELTRLPLQMDWLMQELRARDLYFIDSRTTAETVAALRAQEYGVQHLSRKVFLDNDRSVASIARQFELAIGAAKAQGVAVAIAHPYPETIDFLQQALPTLQQRGIDLVPASEMVTVTGQAEKSPTLVTAAEQQP